MGLRKFRVLLVMGLMLPLLLAGGGCKLGPWKLWNAYSARFIDDQGRVIDHASASHTTSEGQAYALFFALADNDRGTFDRVLTWTQANMAHGDLQTHLPGWLWGQNKDGVWTLLDANSASDADVWMAYSLVEAGRLWNFPLYDHLGRQMLVQIAQHEVLDLPGFGVMLMPGPTGFTHARTPAVQAWTLNPSYLPLFVFERLAVVDPTGPWQKIALDIPRLLRQSAVHGYAMDWVDYVPGDGFYPATTVASKSTDVPQGSYDAIRVYLWAGMINRDNRVRDEILDALPAMSIYLVDHDAPPEKVSDQGVPMAQDGPIGFSAALLPYLHAFPHQEKTSARQLIRLSRQKDSVSGLYGRDQAYYDQNLTLFATGYLEGRFSFGLGGELKVEWTRA